MIRGVIALCLVAAGILRLRLLKYIKYFIHYHEIDKNAYFDQ